MGAVANIGVSVTARTDRFNKKMKTARKSLGGFSKQISATRQAARDMGKAFLAVGTAAGVGFTKVLQAGERFNKAMTSSQAIMLGLSQTMRKDMVDASIELARTSLFSADEIARSFFFLTSAGLDVKKSLAALPVVVKFAQAGMFDLSLATSLLTDAQSGMGLKSKDAAKNLENLVRVSDVLVRANQKADQTVEEFSLALTNKAAAAAKFYGIELEEVAAVLGVFADKNRKGEIGGTAFTIVLRDLTTKNIELREAFEAAGIQVFKTSGAMEGAMRPLADILDNINDKMKGLSVEAKKSAIMELGFTRRSLDFLTMILESGDEVRDKLAALNEASGTTAAVASKQMTAWNESIAQVQATWIDFGNKFRPVTEGIAGVMADLAAVVQEVLDTFGQKDVASVFSETLRVAAGAKNMLDRFVQQSTAGVVAGLGGPIRSLPGIERLFPEQVRKFDSFLDGFTALNNEMKENFDQLAGRNKFDSRGREPLFASFERRRAARMEQQDVNAMLENARAFNIKHPTNKTQKTEDTKAIELLKNIVTAITLQRDFGRQPILVAQ